MSWTGYWEGEFEQFHTLFLRWYDNINQRPSTYTLPLRSAATEGGIQRRGRNVSFVWVRTHKEFERRGLALARQGFIYADMLAPPQPATDQEHNNHPERRQSARPIHPGPHRHVSRDHLKPGGMTRPTVPETSSRRPSRSTKK